MSFDYIHPQSKGGNTSSVLNRLARPILAAIQWPGGVRYAADIVEQAVSTGKPVLFHASSELQLL